MQIIINNQPTETAAATVQALVVELGLPERGVAVAIANRMVPRTAWESMLLNENDSVTIIKAAFGG